MTEDELIQKLGASQQNVMHLTVVKRELEKRLDKAVDFCRRLERLAMQSEDWFVFDKCQEILDELEGRGQ
jgi:hypothetical protein